MKNIAFFLIFIILQIYPIISIDNNGYANFRGFSSSDDTYFASSKQIINGIEAEYNRYPYMVGLALSNSSQPYCGGSLIDPVWVLSAAHCFKEENGTAFIGRHNFSDNSEMYEAIEIKQQIIHPDYDDILIDYDYMLVRLAEPSNASVIELDYGSIEFDFQVVMTVMGWGKTKNFGDKSDYLRETDVKYFEQSWCQFLYGWVGGVTDRMICAKGWNTDACSGDSGGPLIMKGDDGSSDVLVGIVSWGFLCNFLVFPGVYASVPNGLEFIREYVPSI